MPSVSYLRIPFPVAQSKLTQFVFTTLQDGYTLERVDVYGLIDGVHETMVIPGAECYVGRNDNPSFSPCNFFLFSIPTSTVPAFHISPLFIFEKTSFNILDDSSWFGVTRHTFGCYLACRRSVRPEQGTLLSALSGGREGRRFFGGSTMTGRRQDYVFNLAAAVRALAPEAYDSHLFALEVRPPHSLCIHFLVPPQAAGTL